MQFLKTNKQMKEEQEGKETIDERISYITEDEGIKNLIFQLSQLFYPQVFQEEKELPTTSSIQSSPQTKETERDTLSKPLSETTKNLYKEIEASDKKWLDKKKFMSDEEYKYFIQLIFSSILNNSLNNAFRDLEKVNKNIRVFTAESANSKKETEKIYFISASKALEKLTAAPPIHCYIDTTIKITIELFDEYKILLISSIDLENKTCDLLWLIFYQTAEEETYFNIYKYLKDNFNFNPQLISTDFEISSILALNKLFKEKNIQFLTCYYHFKQSIISKFFEYEIIKKNNYWGFTELLMNLSILYFIPSEKVPMLFDLIKSNYTSEKEKNFFNNYFEPFWLSPTMIKLWNDFDLINEKADLDKYFTLNNLCENYHKHINSIFPNTEPVSSTSFTGFINYLFNKEKHFFQLTSHDYLAQLLAFIASKIQINLQLLTNEKFNDFEVNFFQEKDLENEHNKPVEIIKANDIMKSREEMKAISEKCFTIMNELNYKLKEFFKSVDPLIKERKEISTKPSPKEEEMELSYEDNCRVVLDELESGDENDTVFDKTGITDVLVDQNNIISVDSSKPNQVVNFTEQKKPKRPRITKKIRKKRKDRKKNTKNGDGL